MVPTPECVGGDGEHALATVGAGQRARGPQMDHTKPPKTRRRLIPVSAG
jgi:hypothetical protein